MPSSIGLHYRLFPLFCTVVTSACSLGSKSIVAILPTHSRPSVQDDKIQYTVIYVYYYNYVFHWC